MKNILHITSSITLCLLMAFNLGCDKEKDIDSTGIIYGMVVDDNTDDPISGAKIILEKQNRKDYDDGYYWRAWGSVLSDADGRFGFANIDTHIQYFIKGDFSVKKKVVEQASYAVTIEAPAGYRISGEFANQYSETIYVTLDKEHACRIYFKLHKK